MRAPGSGRVLLTRAVALLLVVCLAECAAEQRMNSRVGNQPSLVDKGNGWRAQRGGSCLSYGHSCWGAHGKRSGKAQTEEEAPPAHFSDWYLAKLLRRMSGAALYPAQKLLPLENLSNSDLNAIFRERLDDSQDLAKLFESGESVAAAAEEARGAAAPSMADAAVEPRIKAKLLQIMNEASDDK